MIALPVIDAVTLIRPLIADCLLCDYRQSFECGARAAAAIKVHLIHAHGDGEVCLP